MATKKTFVITRFDPDKDEVPKTQSYEIECQDDWKVLDAINFIKDEIDASISHRWSCRMAVCGSCGMMVNGEPKLTCKTALSSYGDTVEVEPLANFPIVKDLVMELEAFMDKFKRVKPWTRRTICTICSLYTSYDGYFSKSENQIWAVHDVYNCAQFSQSRKRLVQHNFIGPRNFKSTRVQIIHNTVFTFANDTIRYDTIHLHTIR